MGKYNSSIYRVRPLMEMIRNDFQMYQKVLGIVGIHDIGMPESYWYDGFDCAEKQLKPSKEHLESLIEYISKKDFKNVEIRNEKRKALCTSSPDIRMSTCKEAIEELNRMYNSLTPSSKLWFIFEGYTNPDIFIEGEDYVIICEGKWTESHITTHTTNLSAKDGEYRNQMVRHIQGALNYTKKKIYAFYIVDEKSGYLEKLTKEAFTAQLEQETISINDIEKANIINAFYGFTTWQEIEKIIPNIGFMTKEQIEAQIIGHV